MAERKPFLFRGDRDLLDALQRWADDELRSLNGQMEFILRDALRRAGRTPKIRPTNRADGRAPSTPDSSR